MNPIAAVRRFFAPPPPQPLRYAPVKLDLQESLEYSKTMLGDIGAAAALSYGVGKFFMGVWSDRSDARKFMATGLLLSAVCNFAFGASTNYQAHLWLWTINGLAQGMGWPPCGRTMGHWFSESERGLKFSLWNTSHNFGGAAAGYLAAGAVARFGGWQYAFYIPGVIAVVGAAYILARLRDTPQSVGLPPIEEYRSDYPPVADDGLAPAERELTLRELLIDRVLLSPWIWLLAAANFFAYITRYSMLDWGPTYLREVKGASLEDGGFSTVALELGGVVPTIALGWVSDKLGGRRGMVAALCMLPVVAAFAVILYTPPGLLWLDLTMLFAVGFFIYPVINLITIAALDIASKKAIGAAAGFIGLMGYIGRAALEKGFGGVLDAYSTSHSKQHAWEIVLYLTLASGVISTVLLALTWKMRPRA
jgi:MFS transporter, OPA family, glycerol-3-phosphate transporter